MDVYYKLTDHFNEANDAVREGVKLGLKAFAFAIHEEAIEKIGDYGFHPDGRKYLILTGAMRRSLYVQADGFDGRESALSAALSFSKEASAAAKGTTIDTAYQAKVGACVVYAIYHEMGTITIPARPFLKPAAATVQAKAGDLVGRFVAAEVRKAGG